MDEIIWSSESLQLIASALRETSNEMEAEITRLRHCRNEVPLALRDENGTLQEDILEQVNHAIQKLTDASERASDLARVVRFTDTLFEETERAVQRQYDSIVVSVEMGETILSSSWEMPAHVAVAPGLARRTVAVPEWLSSMAEQFFQGAFPYYSGNIELPL